MIKKLVLPALCAVALLLGGCTQVSLDQQTPTTPVLAGQAASESDIQAVEAVTDQTPAPASADVTEATPVPEETTEPESSTVQQERETTGQPMEDPDRWVWTSKDGTLRIRLPESWEGRYTVEEDESSIRFYNSDNHEAGYGGALFSILSFPEGETWEFLPDFAVLGSGGGTTYVAMFPTDVQCDTQDQALLDSYSSMADGLWDWLSGAVEVVG